MYVTYFFITLFDYAYRKLKEEMDALIDFCVLRRERVYTKKLVKTQEGYRKVCYIHT